MLQPLSNVCQDIVEKFSSIVPSGFKSCLTIIRQGVHNPIMKSYYSIRAVAEETGLSPHTIRAWERRYGVIAPRRTGTNRRVYGEGDIRRLKLLQRAVESGHSIGMIAALPTEELDRLASVAATHEGIGSAEVAQSFLNHAMQALQSLDASAFEAILVRASLVLGVDALVDGLVVPLMQEVGKKWEEGKLSIAQEHLASALVRTHLERTRLTIQPSPDAPRLIAATPAGQHHEIGALIAAIVAARMDWDVTYLGPNLPAEEISEAAERTRATAVALSLVHPSGDPGTESELRRLGVLLAGRILLLVGGDAANSYSQALKESGASICADMGCFREWLIRVRALGAL